MKFLFYCHGDDGNLEQTFRERLDGKHQLYSWGQNNSEIPYSEIEAAMVWLPPDSFFDNLPKLKHVYAIAAGVDHLLQHPGLPKEVNVIRLRDAGMGTQMAEYVLYGTLHAQRLMQAFHSAQQQRLWKHELTAKSAAETRIGILGAGALGSIVAKRLTLNGYPVTCWSRSARADSQDYKSVDGQTALPGFLANTDVLVCLLPLTNATTGILNSDLFRQLPKGAFIINPGRGGHLVDSDLIDALDNDQLSGALLDVFQKEPLDEQHPFWAHPKILITPHVAAKSVPDTSADQIIESINSIDQGKMPQGLVDRSRGY